VKVGITFDLRDDYLAQGYDELQTAEFDRPDTIDAIQTGLEELGYSVDRIGNCKALISRLAKGDRWDFVFNICEGMFGFAREAQVPAVLEAFEIPFTFADALTMSVCLHKSLTKLVLVSEGLPTPKSLLVESEAQLGNLDLSLPLFVKPVAQGTSKGITSLSRIGSYVELHTACTGLMEQFQEPVLVEEFLPGREFTVGIIGTGDNAYALGTLEIILRSDADQDVYSYRNKEECESLVEYRLVSASSDPAVEMAEGLAVRAWRALRGRDAGRVDLRCNASGEPEIIEVNPLAGMHPTHSDLPMLATALGMEYRELIRRIVDSTLIRTGR
jgi:D-alanine-D-alanine ligase